MKEEANNRGTSFMFPISDFKRVLPLLFGFLSAMANLPEQIPLRLILLKLFFEILLGEFVEFALGYLLHQQFVLPLYLQLLVLLVLVFVTFVLGQAILLSCYYLGDVID